MISSYRNKEAYLEGYAFFLGCSYLFGSGLGLELLALCRLRIKKGEPGQAPPLPVVILRIALVCLVFAIPRNRPVAR